MVQTAQIIVSGFHRSGTSMAMQSLSRAGVFTGDRLIGADSSNPDGHFEDYQAVRMHDAWLSANQTNWCHTGKLPSVEQHEADQSINRIIQRFESQIQNSDSKVWGLKDPRAALFLKYWFDALDNPYGVFVYRHFASCLRSLQHRQANALLLNPSIAFEDIRFWSHPDVALASWLVHNKAILELQALYPERCILVSQEAQIDGYDLAANVGSTFDLPLVDGTHSGVDATKTNHTSEATLSCLQLKDELTETWDRLQSLSVAPASGSTLVQWTNASSSCSLSRQDTDRLEKLWHDIGISHAA